jgi:hypothetical protein
MPVRECDRNEPSAAEVRGGTPELTSTYPRPAVRPMTRVRRAQAGAPLPLFFTNFGAILLTELIVMAIYRVRATAVEELGAAHRHPLACGRSGRRIRGRAGRSLAVDSAQITSQQLTNADVTTVADTWANKVGWQVVNISTSESGVTVRTIGSLALPNPQTLRAAFNANGLKTTSVQLELDPVKRVDLPGSRTPATDTANAATATEVWRPSSAFARVTLTRTLVEKYDRV